MKKLRIMVAVATALAGVLLAGQPAAGAASGDTPPTRSAATSTNGTNWD